MRAWSRAAGWIVAAAAALAAPASPLADSAPPRPNVLFLLADDLGRGDLSAYGAHDLETPQIDRLAREGMRFSDFSSAASTCSPRAPRSSRDATRSEPA